MREDVTASGSSNMTDHCDRHQKKCHDSTAKSKEVLKMNLLQHVHVSHLLTQALQLWGSFVVTNTHSVGR